MFKPTPYEAIYSFNKLHNPEPPLVHDELPLMSQIEVTCILMEGTMFNRFGDPWQDPYEKADFVINARHPYRYNPDALPVEPILPKQTGDPWLDADNEFRLISKLNAAGNIRARRKFIDMQRFLNYKLTPDDREMLKLADFVSNDNWDWLLKPGKEVAIGILCDYWPRWFGGRADTYAKYNRDIYWIPWSFFMDDEYINSVKEDLVANLFNKNAVQYLNRWLLAAGKMTDKIENFDLADGEPLFWNTKAYQQRVVDYHHQLSALRTPQYWALGNFSINALPKGTVIPMEGGGHRICVSGVNLFIHDTFNFEGFAPLGLWDTENKTFPSLSLNLRAFFNSDFRNFRKKYGFGKNFIVLSPLYGVPNFAGQCWEVK